MHESINERENYGSFPNPLADAVVKMSKAYGLKYAKAIEKQWGSADDEGSIYRRRLK